MGSLIIHNPNVQRLAENFTGRSWLLPALSEWLEQTEAPMFILTGEPGTGKSSLLAWLAGAGPLPAEPIARARLEQFRAAVKASHFCRADSGTIAPGAMARRLAGQLTQTVPGFGQALTASLADQVQIAVSQTVDQVATGGNVTGVYIKELNLGQLSEELSFNRLLREPLQQLYQTGYDKPILILVDALDEAATYTGAIDIVRLLARLADFPAAVRWLVTTRPDPQVLKQFRQVKPLDLLAGAPPNQDDVYDYARNRLAALAEAEPLARHLSQAADGNFLYAHLLLNDLLARPRPYAELLAQSLPPGLSGLYHDFLNRELGGDTNRWHTDFKPLLGLLAVAQGPGLSRELLVELSQANVDYALQRCAQYLDGWPNGPFRLFHRSFGDFLLRDKSNHDYLIDPAEAHQQLAGYYLENYDGSWVDCEAYGLRYLAVHLAGATKIKSPAKRHQRIEQLVRLVRDSDFQQAHQIILADPPALQQDLVRALQVVAADTHHQAPSLVVEAALALLNFRRDRLQPGSIFELAAAGEIEAARNRLALFGAEPHWQRTGTLAIAWLAADQNPAAARQLLETLTPDLLTRWPLPRLMERVIAHLDQQPPPPLDPLPPPLDLQTAQEVIANMGGLKGKLAQEFISGLNFNEALMQFEGAADNEAMVYVAAQDGPLLVACALASPQEGSNLFEQYLSIHAANNYVHYRNLSLWILLDAVLRHPDPDWARIRVARLVEAALPSDRLAFQQALPFTLAALQAATGRVEQGQWLDEQRETTLDEIRQLRPERGYSDSWGSYKRTLAALAEALTLLPGRRGEIDNLLHQLQHIPRGFAGYETAAWLSIAESWLICQENSYPHLLKALEQAEISAHNIQDSTFCGRATARVTALRERWWPAAPLPVSALVERLSQTPDDPEFTALHQVSQPFVHRNPNEGHKLPLAYALEQGNTLRQLAEIFHFSLGDFLQANQKQGWTADTPLTPGTPVNVPDPELIPLLATRLAAELLARPEIAAKERVQLLQRLVPIAAANPTALNIVLSRLLLAAQPVDPQLWQRLDEVTEQLTRLLEQK